MQNSLVVTGELTGKQAAERRPGSIAAARDGKARSSSASAVPVVAHVTTSLDVGGAQMMLAKLVSARQPGVRPRHRVLSLMRPGAVSDPLHACDCPVYDLGMRRGLPGPAAVLRLIRACGAAEPDLLQGWMYHGNLAASLGSVVSSVPVIWNVRHSLADIRRERASTRALLRWSARLSRHPRAIIYNSRVSAEEHERIGFSPEGRMIIPNGFDCERFAPDRPDQLDARALFGIPGGSILVAMVARLHPMKDHANLVRAVRQAREAGHDIHLLMVGSGLDRPPASLSSLIANSLPPDRVTLVGERSDVRQWLPSVDVVALSSAWGEAFPNIIGEAMACAVPCAATDVGDCRWIVDDAGFVVPPGDSAAFAGALAKLAVMGRDKRKEMGLRGRARIVRHFAIEAIAGQYLRLYQRVLASPDAPLASSINAGAAPCG